MHAESLSLERKCKLSLIYEEHLLLISLIYINYKLSCDPYLYYKDGVTTKYLQQTYPNQSL